MSDIETPRRWRIRKAKSGRWWVMLLTARGAPGDWTYMYMKIDDQPTWRDAIDSLTQSRWP